ncbi:hypothetical protein MWQ_01075 [Acinetobacter seifertii]|nr:hypothetical protein MWQ_01075 [Acinetobacter seifertii]
MCKANSFFIGSSADIKIMVAERKRVDRLVKDITSTPEGVPLPSYRYKKGDEEFTHKSIPQTE